MITIKFIIRKMEDAKEQPIYITTRFGRNEKLMYATPLKIKAAFWDKNRQRLKNSKYCPYKDEYNSMLASIDASVKQFIADAGKAGNTLSKDELREFLDVRFGKKSPKATDFHSFFEEFIRLCDTRVSTNRPGQTIAERTKISYRSAYRAILDYEADRGVKLDFNNIIPSFLTDFVAYLQMSFNYSANTICNRVRCIKAVMKAANDQDLTTNIKYRLFKSTFEDSFSIALDEQELDRLLKCDLSNNIQLDRIRDLFLIGCCTGLRFSDFTSIREENIKDNVLTILQQKTGKYVFIPINAVFVQIWSKYGGKLPSNISTKAFDEKIKDVCRIAGINERVIKPITKGGKRITTMYEKWQLVSAHTARRSFATNLYRSGFPSLSIMAITGHRTESSFLKYIKISREEHAQLLMRHWQKTGKMLVG